MHANTRQHPPVSIPAELESAQAKLIYLSLSLRDDSETRTVDDLCCNLNVDKGAALSILATLRERGYVERRDGRYHVLE
ncbi:helix-turn-helix domain-containing protein [Natronosalvus amylolyticus]|uniref:helix-turn-helix domain-containing protein n=1 Tax=Natronosalvus amylolyticus TaxID=2961994 RepID=UPI0020C977C5|nr:helix-turn-helix domain-containing protein [Natronosalvus amylolyticus]